MQNRKIHRGDILHGVAKRSIKTITRIAADAGYEKSSFYVHIKKEDLDLDIIFKYGKSIPHNFDVEIPEMSEYLETHKLKKEDDDAKPDYEQVVKEKERWKDKYYTLLEEHTILLKGK